VRLRKSKVGRGGAKGGWALTGQTPPRARTGCRSRSKRAPASLRCARGSLWPVQRRVCFVRTELAAEGRCRGSLQMQAFRWQSQQNYTSGRWAPLALSDPTQRTPTRMPSTPNQAHASAPTQARAHLLRRHVLPHAQPPRRMVDADDVVLLQDGDRPAGERRVAQNLDLYMLCAFSVGGRTKRAGRVGHSGRMHLQQRAPTHTQPHTPGRRRRLRLRAARSCCKEDGLRARRSQTQQSARCTLRGASRAQRNLWQPGGSPCVYHGVPMWFQHSALHSASASDQ